MRKAKQKEKRKRGKEREEHLNEVIKRIKTERQIAEEAHCANEKKLKTRLVNLHRSVCLCAS